MGIEVILYFDLTSKHKQLDTEDLSHTRHKLTPTLNFALNNRR